LPGRVGGHVGGVSGCESLGRSPDGEGDRERRDAGVDDVAGTSTSREAIAADATVAE